MIKHVPKPEWLKIKLGDTPQYAHTATLLHTRGLNTICASGKCPNQGECWSRGTATFMIGGNICTRACRFCNTQSGRPLPLDINEGERIAKTVEELKLRYVVLTSVDRDDLADYGAGHWIRVINNVRERCPEVIIEALIPDFRGDLKLVDDVCRTDARVVAHNIETVERLTPEVRSVATYRTSLSVISQIARSGKTAKSGLMLGLGETEEEVIQTMRDLHEAGCEVLTIGQYLQPTRKHYPVQAYINPKKFEEYKQKGLEIGFRIVESGALVRSSYHADAILEDDKS